MSKEIGQVMTGMAITHANRIHIGVNQEPIKMK